MSQPIIELPDIVQSLQNKQWTGTLEILSGSNSEQRSTSLFFQNGMIQHASPDRNALVLGRALYTLGLIDEADYVMTMTNYEKTGRRVGEELVSLGLVDEQGIRKALLFQGREHVLDVFTWQNVDVKFHAGDEDLIERFTPQQREVSLNLAGMSILMEAARRVDEWSAVHEMIASEHDVVASTAETGLPAGLIDRRVALLIDCYRSASEIASQAPKNTLDVLQELAQLVRDGHLKCLEPAELVKVGLVAEQDKDYEKALRVYELAAERGLDHLDLHRRVARVYSLLGRMAESLERWIGVADRCVSLDRRDLAIAALTEALELDGDNIEMRQRLVKLLLEANDRDTATRHLRTLVEIVDKQEPAQPALQIEVLTEYLEYRPDDKEILERLAQIHLGEDNKLEAMVVLDDLATVLTAEEKLEDSVSVYYRVLDIDAENLQARLLLAQNLTKLGSTDDAVREYRRLADILYKSGVIGNSINWPFLIKVYESIVELEPLSTAAWEWLAKAYMENGQQDLAISRFLKMADSLEPGEGERPPPQILNPLRRVVELDPKNLDVRRRLAHAHLGLNQIDRAVAALRGLAEQALEAGLVDSGKAAYDEALEHNPFDMDSRRGLAAIHEQREEYDQAYAAWTAVGGMCHRAGLFDAAVKDFHRAFQIRDDDPITVRELAQIEQARGRDRNSAMLYARYAQLMISQANYGMAREALETAGRLEPDLPQVASLMAKLASANS